MPERGVAPGAVPLAATDPVGVFLDRWQQLHGGVDPRGTVLVRRWLTAVHTCARPLARRQVRPDVLTLVGLVLALATVPAALAGGRWALLVGGLAAASASVDSLDGAVAVLTGRVTVWGALLDAVCDRCADMALAMALVLLAVGAGDPVVSDPVLTAVAAGAVVLPLLHEYVRARAASLSMRGLDLVTWGERPSRVIVVVMFALATGVTTSSTWAFVGLCVVAGSGLGGLAQLLHRLHRDNG